MNGVQSGKISYRRAWAGQSDIHAVPEEAQLTQLRLPFVKGRRDHGTCARLRRFKGGRRVRFRPD
jgi:hypothetical protein